MEALGSESTSGSATEMRAPKLAPTLPPAGEPIAVSIQKIAGSLKSQLDTLKQQEAQMMQQLEIAKLNIKKLEGALETCELFGKQFAGM